MTPNSVRATFLVRALLGVVLLATGTMLGCGDAPGTDQAAPAPAPAATGDGAGVRGARTLPIPPLGGGQETAHTGHGPPLIWDVPEGWVAVPPPSSMRLAQYTIPGPGGEASCIVYYFGPGQGGDPMANAARWAGQFEQDDGVPSSERMTIETVEGASIPSRIVSVRGTYNGGMTMTDQPSPSQPIAMLLGGISVGPDAPWFFKLTGPETTVQSQRAALEHLLRSLRPAPAGS